MSISCFCLEIDLSKFATNMKVTGLFLDPMSYHLLIAMIPKYGNTNLPPELWYLHKKTAKLKQVIIIFAMDFFFILILIQPCSFLQAGKFKGHEITAVGWNFYSTTESSSGPILLGTSKGLIFETEIGLDGDKIFNTSLEQYWKQVN